MKQEIESFLRPLIGKSMWGSARAADMEMFAFGSPKATTTTRGRAATRGEFALHVQCPWRIARVGTVVVGSQDFRYPPGNPFEEPTDFNPDAPGANRRDARLLALFQERVSEPLTVKAMNADAAGGVSIGFQDGYVLEVFPAHSLDTESHSEHWRLLRPDSSEPHFVVTGRGIVMEGEG